MTSTPQLSVVIPSYDSAPWLPSTFEALARAVQVSGLDVEVLVVDDGSTDDTIETVQGLADAFPGDVRVVAQANQGRFLARYRGLQEAAADWVLLLDSRVLIEEDALRHAFAVLDREPHRTAWNAWVHTDPAVPLIGLFWEVPTKVFWGGVTRRRHVVELTPANFDRAPKGTTMFLARTDVLRRSFEECWPEGTTKLVSDDTKLLRLIAEQEGIRLDPGFAAVYRPRTSVRAFVPHSFHRGTVFVDAYAGTTPLRSVVLLLLTLAPALLAGVLTGSLLARRRGVTAATALALGAGVVAPAVVAARNGAGLRALAAFVLYLPLFVAPFWLGLVRGVVVHRRAFSRGSARRRAARQAG